MNGPLAAPLKVKPPPPEAPAPPKVPPHATGVKGAPGTPPSVAIGPTVEEVMDTEEPAPEEVLKQQIAAKRKELEWAKGAPNPSLTEGLAPKLAEELKQLEAQLAGLKPPT